MSSEWLEWYYLIFLLPLVLALLVLLLSSMGGHHGRHAPGSHGGFHLLGHAAGHVGSVHGGDAGHAAGSHGGAAAGHGTGHAHTVAAHADHAAANHGHGTDGRASDHANASTQPDLSTLAQVLGFFGIGRAPITIVVGSLLMGWGIIGFLVVDTLRPVLGGLAVVFALGAGVLGALVFARLFSWLAIRLMPQEESYAITREGLLGLTATVVYPVSESGGRVHIFDQFRTLHVEPARVPRGHPTVARGEQVLVVDADPGKGYLIVDPLGRVPE